MYQKIILILKSEKNREILKLTENAGKVRVEAGDSLVGARLLTDIDGDKSYDITGKTFSIAANLPADVSAVAIIDGETYSGFSGKTNRCPYLLEKLRSGGFDRKEENADSLSGNEIKDNTGNADESASGQNSFSDAKNKETSAEQGDEIILRAKTKSESKDKTEGAKKDKPTMLLGVEFNGKNFYQAVKPQLEEMFVCYPTEALRAYPQFKVGKGGLRGLLLRRRRDRGARRSVIRLLRNSRQRRYFASRRNQKHFPIRAGRR